MQNIDISENETLSSSSAAVSITEPTPMKPENGQPITVSASQNASEITIKGSFGYRTNLTAAALTPGGDSTAILQAPTAVTVQPVSIGPMVFCPTPIELANNTEPQIDELPIINISENEILSSSSTAVSITEPTSLKPENDQSKTVSASQNTSEITIKGSFGYRPNLTAAALTPGDDTAAILQAPTAVTVQPISIEPMAFCPTPIELANNVELQINELPTVEVEIRSPSISSDRQVSTAESNRDSSGETDAKSRYLAGCPKPLWSSMPNIALHYTDSVSYDTEIKFTTPMRVSRDLSTRSSTTLTEPAVTQVKIKRSSLWKRAKKFARRVFCCAA
ncbi:unnamed protein product [Aphis gossypii]|uniref:Uncharacterized protein n=1 Tax=Aphis gossypii TaxID=80765 RepID=A0A9P0JF88_APHGO|nr:unnamed protein product [Aphis gossypii]